MNQNSCPVCGQKTSRLVLKLDDVPVHCNVLFRDRYAAENAPLARIELARCGDCGHVYNRVFDIAKTGYTSEYDASLFFSNSYRGYAKATADSLIARYDLRNKTILEIGCGDAKFLELICELGNNDGIGLDPGIGGTEVSASTRIHLHSDLFDKESAKYMANFVVCRHVLEHLEHPKTLIEDIFHTFLGRPGSGLYFEVPNANYIFEDISIWDLIYEHYSYFTPESLRSLFEQVGFKINLLKSAYSNQFLCLEAQVERSDETATSPVHQDGSRQDSVLEDFSVAVSILCKKWRETLLSLHQRDEKIALWGAGSKGVTFLNIIDPNHMIDYAVDINPGKVDKYVPGTGHRVVAPAQLYNNPPQHVLIMNPVYKDEIETNLLAMNISPIFYQV